MKLSEMQKKYVFSCRIELDEDKNFIEVSELTFAEKAKLEKVSEKEYTQELKKLMPSHIVHSSFEDDEGNPATGGDIVKIMEQSGSLLDEAIQIWITSIPFEERLKKPEKLKNLLAEASGKQQQKSGQ